MNVCGVWDKVASKSVHCYLYDLWFLLCCQICLQATNKHCSQWRPGLSASINPPLTDLKSSGLRPLHFYLTLTLRRFWRHSKFSNKECYRFCHPQTMNIAYGCLWQFEATAVMVAAVVWSASNSNSFGEWNCHELSESKVVLLYFTRSEMDVGAANASRCSTATRTSEPWLKHRKWMKIKKVSENKWWSARNCTYINILFIWLIKSMLVSEKVQETQRIGRLLICSRSTVKKYVMRCITWRHAAESVSQSKLNRCRSHQDDPCGSIFLTSGTEIRNGEDWWRFKVCICATSPILICSIVTIRVRLQR